MRILALFFALNSFFGMTQSDSTVIYEMDGVPVPLDDGWGWYDLNNKQLSDSLFFQDFLPPQNASAYFFVLKNDSLWGALNGSGLEELPFVYDSIIIFNNHILTLKGGIWTYIQRFEEEDVKQTVEFDSLFWDGYYLYVYSNGKTGLIVPSGTYFPPVYASIRPFTVTNSRYETDEFGYYMVLDGKEFNVLDETGQALLPPNVWDLRSAHRGIFEFRRGEHPEYYSIYSNEIITPNGRDIVFYGELGYKLYNESKTKGVLHRYDKPVLDAYDDYFILISETSQGSELLAVRKNGKVGLLKDGVLQGSIKYDQINTLSNFFGYDERSFLFFVGDSCGLLSDQGVERIAPKYANILATSDGDRYIVLDRGVSGVVDGNGKTIIPLQYDYIAYNVHSELFLVENNKRVGLFRRDGSVLIPIEYEKHRLCGVSNWDWVNDSESGIHILVNDDNLYFANSLGLIDGIAYNHYDYTKGVLKAYKANGITVFALAEDGLVEEVVNYPMFNAAIVEDDYRPFNYVFHGWQRSYLEENQKEGYFGLRLYDKRGFGVPPRYRNVRITVGSDALGEVAYTDSSIPFLDTVPMTIIRRYDEMNPGSGSITNRPLFSTEALIFKEGLSSNTLNYGVDGSQLFIDRYEHQPTDLSDGVRYADFLGESSQYRRFFIGGKVEVCAIEEADVSLYEYYVYWNLADACRLDHAWMSKVLDPKVGVRFVNSKRVLIDAKYNRRSGIREFNKAESFHSFNFVNPIVYFEQKLDAKVGELKRNVVEKGVEQPVVKECVDARSVELTFGQDVEAHVKTTDLAKIHVEYPNYFFRANERDLSYDAGRISRQLDESLVRLITPTNIVIWDSCLAIRYLNNNRFGVQTAAGWRLIDRDGKLINESVFRAVNPFEDNQADFLLVDGAALILNVNGEIVQKMPEPPVFLGKNYYYLKENASKIFEMGSDKSDLMQADEKFLEGYFIKKQDGKTSVRRFGSLESIELELPSALKSFGKRLYYVDKEIVVSIDSNLTIKKYKKIKSFRAVSPEIGWLEGKRDVLIDQQWNILRTLSKEEHFELRNGDLVILEKDSVTLNFGSLKPRLPLADSTEVNSISTPEPVVEVIYRNGKFGAVRGDENILPFDYTTLSKLNDEEFFASLGFEKQLFTSELERVGDAPYDYFLQTATGHYVFYSYNGQWSAVSLFLEKIY